MNDASMILAAGTGVAMGNAPEELRNMADLVTGTLKEEGVPAALKQLGLI